MSDLELCLVGLVMASTVYHTIIDDPAEDFDLWAGSWPAAKSMFNVSANELEWLDTGFDIEGNRGWGYRKSWR